MSSETIVRHCAPTLAGLKTGNLFSCMYGSRAELIEYIKVHNRMLNSKGVYFTLIRFHDGCALIYVYRRNRLEKALSEKRIQRFLGTYGYSKFDIISCLSLLRKRFKGQEFPHEIGIFLGYPLDDIIAFIENKGANCKCTGIWKAYTDVQNAQKTFRLYEKCSRIYLENFINGSALTRLTVAG